MLVVPVTLPVEFGSVILPTALLLSLDGAKVSKLGELEGNEDEDGGAPVVAPNGDDGGLLVLYVTSLLCSCSCITILGIGRVSGAGRANGAGV